LGAIDARAIKEERDAYDAFIRSLSERDLEQVEPLAYRRVLSQSEAGAAWKELRKRWTIGDGHWFPLTDSSVPGLIAIYADAFAAVPVRTLQSILQKRWIDRIYELREFGPQYECDTELFEPVYTGAEDYWSAAAFDWIAYASHENSITLGGWLADAVKQRWPAWRAHEWC
jgi:hypothetical protein